MFLSIPLRHPFPYTQFKGCDCVIFQNGAKGVGGRVVETSKKGTIRRMMSFSDTK